MTNVPSKKKTLERILSERGAPLRNAKVSELKRQVLKGSGPFGLEPNLPQEEKVLSLMSISDYFLRKELGTVSNLTPREIDELDRGGLLSNVLNEELGEKAKEVLTLTMLKMPTLRKMAGREYGNKAELIRIVAGISKDNRRKEIIDLEAKLRTIGFELRSVPEEIVEAKPFTKRIYNLDLLLKAIESGYDVSGVETYQLGSVVNNFTLLRRLSKREDLEEYARQIVSYPPLSSWRLKIRPFAQTQKEADLMEVARSIGYNINKIGDLEFLLSRGYLIGIRQEFEFNLEDASPELLDALDGLYGSDTVSLESSLSGLTKARKKFVRKLISIDSAEDQMEMASTYGYSMSYLEPHLFWENAPLYESVSTRSVLEFGAVELDEESLSVFTDFELLKYYPGGPWGRQELIDGFIEYWGENHYYFLDNEFYYGDWSEDNEPISRQEMLDSHYENLEWNEAVDLLGWVRHDEELRGDVMGRLRQLISWIELPEGVPTLLLGTPPAGEKVTNETMLDAGFEVWKNIFSLMVTVGALSVGLQKLEDPYPEVPGPINESLYEEWRSKLDDLLATVRSEQLKQFSMVDLYSEEPRFRKKTLASLKRDSPSFSWTETGSFYLIKYFGEAINQTVYIMNRPH